MAGKKSWRLATGMLIASVAGSLLLVTPGMVEAQSGTVVGTVLDTETGLALSGVTVRVEGTDVGAVSNPAGRFAVRGVPVGSQTLVIEYLGYGTVTERVDVTSDVVSVRIEITTEAIGVEGLTVVGQRRGQAAALGQQLAAPTITNVVAADQIGRFPDANIGDAIKRIPGITVIQDQGEARFGLIRGTEPRLNSVMINGERIPSAEAEVREVQLDLVPSDMVAQVEVTKALTPDMDADAIGGSVNIVTRAAPADQRLAVTLGSGYNFLASEPMGIGNVVFGQRFAQDRLGLILSGSYYDHQLGSDNIEAEWNDDGNGAFVEEFQIREYQVQRIRRSVSAALDFRLDDANTVTWRSMYNHRDDWENRFRLVIKKMDEPDGAGNTMAKVERQSKGGIGTDRVDNRRLEDQRTQSHSLSGEHIFSGVLMEWSAQWARASEERPNERYIQFVQKDVPVVANISDPRRPTFTLPATVPADFELDELSEEFQNTQDTDRNARLDFSIPLLAGRTEIRFGGRAREKEKTRENDFYEYDANGISSLADVATADYSNPDYLAGDYSAGDFATEEYLGGLDFQDGSAFEEERKLDEFVAANYAAEEQILAGYAMLEQKLGDQLEVIAGARVERTSVDYAGFEFIDDDESFSPTTGSQEYTDVFPSLIATYRLTSMSNIRAAWTNTISRPNYYDLVPYRIVSQEDSELEVGNPDLQPTTSMNFDLMFEQFFSNVGLISAGVFYKDIEDFIFGYTVDDALDPVTNTTFDEITRPENGGSASLFGFEVAAQRALPAGFGIYANYTFNESSVEGLPILGRESEDLPLPGTSRHTMNGSLSFDASNLTLRASVNLQDAFIDPGEVGDSAFFDRYYDRALTLDLNGEVVVTPTIRAFFEANNLTNQPLRYYQGVSERLMQEEFYSTRVQIGIKADLR
jgi:TonB-dependent receptor